MYYIPYTILKNQLLDKSKAKLIIEGVEVFFEALSDKNLCKVSAKIYCDVDSLTSSLKENLSSLQYLRLHNKGISLKVCLEEGCVILSQDLKVLSGFMLFKASVETFMSTYDFWKSIVEDMVKSDSLFVCHS